MLGYMDANADATSEKLVALAAVGAVLAKTQVSDNVRLLVLGELSRQRPLDLSSAAFAILDGIHLICSLPGGKTRMWNTRTGESISEEEYDKLKPLVTTVYHVSKFYASSKALHAG